MNDASLLLGKYEPLGALGSGSMGTVYAARPVNDPVNTVVVKLLRSTIADTPRARQGFEREAAYTSRLSHPYIVKLIEAGVDPHHGPCLVLEFVPGHTLEAILRKERRLELQRAARLIGCVCHALEAAHHGAIRHGDLKPSNLMVVNSGTRNEAAKVMDFGLARLATKPMLSKERLSGADFVIAQGTAAYLAPEVARGADSDGRADLYALGVIAYEMLVGQHPFPVGSAEQAIQAHLTQDPPTFASMGARHLPPAVEQVVRWCMNKFTADRPQSARELANALGNAIGIDLWEQTAPPGYVEGPDTLPFAEEVKEVPRGDGNSVVHRMEASMPDQIAVIKIGGFLQDAGGTVLHTEPGLLTAHFPPPDDRTGLAKLFRKKAGVGIDLELTLDRPNPSHRRLVLTATFRPSPLGPVAVEWARRCQHLFDEMRKYLMAGG